MPIFLVIFCLSGLVYQTYHLLDEFISGHTVVTMNIGFGIIRKQPALTICIQDFLSDIKLRQMFPELTKSEKRLGELVLKLDKIQQVCNNVNLTDNTCGPSEQDTKEVEDIRRKMDHFIANLSMANFIIIVLKKALNSMFTVT